MRRRAFIAGVGSAAAWPMMARAQQRAMPTIGFLGSGTAEGYAHNVAAFRQGLRETGFVDGQNVVIEYRWAEGQFDRLPSMASDLVRRQLAVIFASGGVVPAVVAKAATSTIPIVFANGTDPVLEGLVPTLNRPGGNVTGISFVTAALVAKRLELLRELVPTASIVGMLVNPNSPNAEAETTEMQEAARAIGLQVQVLHARTEHDLEAVLKVAADARIDALVVSSDPLFFSGRSSPVSQAMNRSVPTIYGLSEYVHAGGLASYGANIADAYRQAGVYVGRILKGEKPGDLPIMQPVKFDLTINLRAAKAIGLVISPAVLARADEVIE